MLSSPHATIPAHYAGSFYPATAAEISATITQLKQEARLPTLPDSPLRAVVLPHAGYIYSGLTAAHVALALEGHHFDPVIAMGPDHRVGLARAAISSGSAFSLPGGDIPIHPLASQLRREYPELYESNPSSDNQEHSVEVILPFLHHSLPPFSFVPMVIGQQDPIRIAASLTPHLTPQTLLAASSDLSHFLPYEEAVAKDKKTLAAILKLDQTDLLANDNKACGLLPIRVIMTLAEENNWQPVLLDYRNSGDTAGDRQRVVGYAGLAFYEG